MDDQERLFFTVTALIQTQHPTQDKLMLIRRWTALINNLRRLMSPLKQYEWGRNIRLQLSFICARLRSEEMRILFSNQPHLVAGGVGYVCDSLRCQLESMEDQAGDNNS